MSLHGTSDSLGFSELIELMGGLRKTGLLRIHCHLGDVSLHLEDGLVGQEAPAGPDRDSDLVETFCDLLRVGHFSFDFEPGEGQSRAGSAPVDMAVVLSAARARLKAWEAVETVIPSLDARLEAIPDVGDRTLILTPVQWALVLGMDGRRRVEALIRLVDGEPLDICRQLRQLVDQGLARVLPEPVTSITRVGTSPEQDTVVIGSDECLSGDGVDVETPS